MTERIVRTSLGEQWTGMTCIACGSHGAMQGLLDRKGSPYVRCDVCRFRVLGLSKQALCSIHFFSAMLSGGKFYESWSEKVYNRMRRIGRGAAPAQVRAPEPAEVGGQEVKRVVS
jgi:hypothetical protein